MDPRAPGLRSNGGWKDAKVSDREWDALGGGIVGGGTCRRDHNLWKGRRIRVSWRGHLDWKSGESKVQIGHWQVGVTLGKFFCRQQNKWTYSWRRAESCSGVRLCIWM